MDRFQCTLQRILTAKIEYAVVEFYLLLVSICLSMILITLFSQETKSITHRSLKLCSEGEQHMRDIVEVLRKDRRYLVLECQPDERSKILMAYMEELEKRGPPPPPTASEPTRRK